VLVKRMGTRETAEASTPGQLHVSSKYSSTTWGRRLRSPPAGPPSTPSRADRARAAARAGPAVLRLWTLLKQLPPIERRLTVWKATLTGSLLFGFGVAAYFRTRVDVLIGAILTTPFLIAVPFLPESDSENASTPNTGPYWAYVLTYSSMALTGLYSYLRATTSNRRYEELASSPPEPMPAAEREAILTRELRILANAGWHVESTDRFEAIASRRARPNHTRHLILTFCTLYVWGIVWLVRTLSARRNPRLEYRRLVVDRSGKWRLVALAADAVATAGPTGPARA
jgi:hypothetical protein